MRQMNARDMCTIKYIVNDEMKMQTSKTFRCRSFYVRPRQRPVKSCRSLMILALEPNGANSSYELHLLIR